MKYFTRIRPDYNGSFKIEFFDVEENKYKVAIAGYSYKDCVKMLREKGVDRIILEERIRRIIMWVIFILSLYVLYMLF